MMACVHMSSSSSSSSSSSQSITMGNTRGSNMGLVDASCSSGVLRRCGENEAPLRPPLLLPPREQEARRRRRSLRYSSRRRPPILIMLAALLVVFCVTSASTRSRYQSLAFSAPDPRKAMYQAITSGSLVDVKQCLDEGVHPSENMYPERESDQWGPFQEHGVLPGREDDAVYPFFHQAVCYACHFASSTQHQQIVQEFVARNPESIMATAEGIVYCYQGGEQDPIPLGDGLNALQFYNRLATIYYQKSMPYELTNVLIGALMEYESMSRFPRTLMEKLHDKEDDDLTVDVHIQCTDGVTVPAHKTILMAASQSFEVIFGNWFDSDDNIWDSQVSSAVMLTIKKYIYLGVVSMEGLTDDDLQELFVKADQFELHDLFRLAEKRLLHVLKAENFAHMLVLAGEREADSKDLFDACVRFFRWHSTELHFDESLQNVKAKHSDVWSRLEESILESRAKDVSMSDVGSSDEWEDGWVDQVT